MRGFAGEFVVSGEADREAVERMAATMGDRAIPADPVADAIRRRVRLPDGGIAPVHVVNPFGNGVADDKLAHGYGKDFIRFYLSEEPIVRSVSTHPLSTPAECREAPSRLRELVVKPVAGTAASAS